METASLGDRISHKINFLFNNISLTLTKQLIKFRHLPKTFQRKKILLVDLYSLFLLNNTPSGFIN